MSNWTQYTTETGKTYYRSEFGGLVYQRSKDRKWVANSYGMDMALFASAKAAMAHLDLAPRANSAADVAAAYYPNPTQEQPQ